MTNSEKNVADIERFLNQYGDGWFFVGFNPKDGEPMMACSAPDAKSEIALNALLNSVLSNGGVGALRERMKDRKRQTEEGAGEEA